MKGLIRQARHPGLFNLYVVQQEKLVPYKVKLTKEQALLEYFPQIEDNLKKYSDNAELLQKYKEKWDSIGLKSVYIDSYGHTWKNTFIPDKDIINYLNNKRNAL